MNIQQSNLLFALNVAIKDQERIEKDYGFDRDSALLGGWRELYEHIRSGGQITLIPSQM
jgi:hypothetical protein